MAAERRVILVGHGGIPKDCPQDLVTRLKRLEAQRRAAKMPPTPEESSWIQRSANGRGPPKQNPIKRASKRWRRACGLSWMARCLP